MRTRITYTGLVSPCGNTTYGEVEDYTLNITSMVPNYWTGAVSTAWSNPLNWSLEHVPTFAEDAVITNLGFQPATVDAASEACNTLVIEAGGNVLIPASTLTVNQDVDIFGSLTMNNAAGTIYVAGNWNNTVGPAGFTAGPGKVSFNGGAYHQYCSDETFNLLEVNKIFGGAFRMSGTNVVCAAYDWAAGAVDVLTGSFTANDLVDSGVYGAYYCNAGGAITLNNFVGNQWVDLNGELHIYGGTVTINGAVSDWTWAQNAVIEMSAGVLDFPSCGINVANIYTLTSNITGGTIRTAYNFSGNRADFTPTAGTVELYGPTDSYLILTNGCTLHNVVINKAPAVTAPVTAKTGSIIQFERSGNPMSPTTLNNTVSLGSSSTFTNTLDIANGSFILNGFTATIGHYCTVGGSLVMTNPADVLNVGTNSYENLQFNAGSTSTLTAGTINPASWVFVAGPATITSSVNNVINFTSANIGGFDVEAPGAVFGTVNVNRPAGATTYFYSNSPAESVEITGNLNIAAGNILSLFGWSGSSTIVHGTVTDDATSVIHELGNLTIYPDFTLHGTLDVSSGNVLLHGNFHSLAGSSINITSGNLVCDVVTPADWQYLEGHLSMSGGLFEVTHSNIQFFIPATSTISGGTMRCSAAFAAINPGNFMPTGGTVEVGSTYSVYYLYCDAGNYFHDLSINHGPGGLSIVQSNFTVNHNLTVNGGEFRLLDYTCSVNGNVNINNAGTLTIPDLGELRLASGSILNVNTGGRLNAVATTLPGKITQTPGSPVPYALNVQSGGTIAAQNCIFEYMNGSGVNLLSGSIVDLSYLFRGCTFRNGTAGGTLLTANNSQTMTVRNAAFPANTWSGASNVTKGVNAGRLYFVDFTGPFSGESFDNDGFNRVDWIPPMTAAASATPATICAGYSSQLNMTATGGLAPLTYVWSPVTGLSNPNIANPVSTAAATTNYSVTVTDALGTALTGSVTLTVNPSALASVSISASANPSPTGSFVIFTATPVNGGAAPTYQWKVNGSNVGTGLPTYFYVPSNNDVVTCRMVSSLATCFYPAQAISNTITMIVAPLNTNVSGTIPSPLNLCFDALNTVTVAGGGSTFHINPGGKATMIAGQKISYLYGTSVSPGGYMHGYITTTNSYCASLPPSMVSVTTGEDENPGASRQGSQSFRVFPNPTTGEFTVEALGDAGNMISQISIYNLSGAKMFTVDLKGERSHRCSLLDVPTGIYFIHVTTGENTGVSKLIKL